MDTHGGENRDHLITVIRFPERQWRSAPAARPVRIAKDRVDPRDELARAARGTGDSLAALSRMLGRPERYLDTFVRDGHPKALTVDDHQLLTDYFGMPLGIRDLWSDRA